MMNQHLNGISPQFKKYEPQKLSSIPLESKKESLTFKETVIAYCSQYGVLISAQNRVHCVGRNISVVYKLENELDSCFVYIDDIIVYKENSHGNWSPQSIVEIVSKLVDISLVA